MDDKFLYENLPAPRPGFGENLYARISRLPASKQGSDVWVLRFGLAVAIAFVLFFTFSEPARASVLYLLRHIAGFDVLETQELPVVDDKPSFAPNQDSFETGLGKLPFKFAMPAYVPDGYTLVNKLEFDDSQASMAWQNANQAPLWMIVQHTSQPSILAGQESVEEIQINGQTALLIRGAFSQGTWDATLQGITIYFTQDGLTYVLGQYPDHVNQLNDKPLITLDELVRMAGSIPPLKNYENGAYSYTPQPITEILENPPFTFKTPVYLPEGYVPGEGIVAYSKAWVSLSWQDQAGKLISLMAQEDWNPIIPAGVDSADELLINGLPTLIIRGGYVDGSWDEKMPMTTLYWRDGGIIYTLNSESVTEDDLIKIAESFK